MQKNGLHETSRSLAVLRTDRRLARRGAFQSVGRADAIEAAVLSRQVWPALLGHRVDRVLRRRPLRRVATPGGARESRHPVGLERRPGSLLYGAIQAPDGGFSFTGEGR